MKEHRCTTIKKKPHQISEQRYIGDEDAEVLNQRLFEHINCLLTWRPGKLARGTISMTVGMVVRTAGQAGVFLIVGRVLGVELYGAYSAVLGLASGVSSFVGMGLPVLMLRDTARNPSTFAVGWGRSIAAIWITFPVLAIFYFLVASAILPDRISIFVTACIGLSELLFAPLSQAGIQAYQGYEHIGRAAWLLLVPILPRVSAALLLVPLTLMLVPGMRLFVWAVLYMLAAMLAASYAMRIVRRELGVAFTPVWSGLIKATGEGWAFAASWTSLKLSADIDKTMLAWLSTLTAAGAYSAAYRVSDMALVPLYSLLAAAVPRFFRTGEQGIVHAARYALRILPFPLIYTVLIGGVLYGSADLLPWLLGPTFAPAVLVLRWLAWLPLMSLPRLLMQNVFIGGDHQVILAMVLSVGAAINILINLWAIPRWGWQGAVGATYITETIISAIMILIISRR